MSKPELINLWPSGARERTDLKRRLVVEVIAVGLLVSLLAVAGALWLNWRMTKVTQVNEVLNKELKALEVKSVEGTVNGGADESLMRLQAQWREHRAGQLNWLAALGVVEQDGIKLTQVKQSEKTLLITGEADNPDQAKIALERFVSKSNRYRLLNLTMLESKTKSEQTTWRFSAELTDEVKPSTAVTAEQTVIQKEQP